MLAALLIPLSILALVAMIFLPGVKVLRLPKPATKKPVLELDWSNWFGFFMWNHGWAGLTTWLPFFDLISYWGAAPEPLTRVHEFQHVAQGDRDPCFLVTWARYAWGLRHGYLKDPMELEAYAVEAAAAQNGLPDWASQPSDSAP